MGNVHGGGYPQSGRSWGMSMEVDIPRVGGHGECPWRWLSPEGWQVTGNVHGGGYCQSGGVGVSMGLGIPRDGVGRSWGFHCRWVSNNHNRRSHECKYTAL